jgi:Ca2+-binding RTX toxin-like protein
MTARAGRAGPGLLFVVLAVALAAALAPASAGAQGRACTITGTQNADYLRGTERADVICGLGGDDRIEAEGGGDVVRGGAGRDTIHSGDGDDTVRAGEGRDRVSAGSGSDEIEGGRGDELHGASGGDRMFGNAGDDVLIHGSGSARDRLDGDRGSDVAHAGDNDRVVQARGPRFDTCPASFANACINFINNSAQDAVFTGSVPDECNGEFPPRTVAADTSHTVYCSVDDSETFTFDYTLDGGATQVSVSAYVPAVTVWDPYVSCSFSVDPSHPRVPPTACIPAFTGDGSSPTSTVYLEPTDIGSPSGMGTGQPCTLNPPPGVTGDTDCPSVGPLQASNSGKVAIASLGPGGSDANVFIVSAGGGSVEHTLQGFGIPPSTWETELDAAPTSSSSRSSGRASW